MRTDFFSRKRKRQQITNVSGPQDGGWGHSGDGLLVYDPPTCEGGYRNDNRIDMDVPCGWIAQNK